MYQDIANALIGGALIGFAAAGMLWANGRIMGISGIVGGILSLNPRPESWRILFILGLLLGSLTIPTLGFTVMEEPFQRTHLAAILGGLLVGVGTSLGGGCTSGHGVCGLSRFSPRSLVATLVFMLLGIFSVFVINQAFGGLL